MGGGHRLHAVDTVYDHLKRLILANALDFGGKFFESDIARKFGVSRTPAREALTRLLSEGVLIKNRRTYSVREFSLPEVQDLFDVRETLECLAVATAARVADETTLAPLIELFAMMNQAAQKDDCIPEFNELDRRFHMNIALMSKNRFLIEALSVIQDKAMMVRHRYLAEPQGMLRAQADHALILAAIERRNPEAATAEMRHHIRSSVARRAQVQMLERP